ncbi:hypothetical protein JXA02_05775, partial [candidate division KSB1 bacterium]|nr:hypothetical protein [candidate division KSB1 bacterium]
CRSITAWCSCEIKAQNPGIDLLISADWSQPFGGRLVQNEPLPPLTGLAGFLPLAESTVVNEPVSAPAPAATPAISDSATAFVKNDSTALSVNNRAQTSSGALKRNFVWLAALGFVLIFASSVILKSKRK